jgi:glycerol uptake facilitator-like aquaporin
MTPGLPRQLAAEACGCVLLTAAVVGSGVMGERLAAGNEAVALIANTGATVAALVVLISLFSPVSGAHFNPAVTLVMAVRRRVAWTAALSYIAVQIIGCCVGTLLAHAMFELPLLETSTHVRSGTPQFASEIVATCGLLLVVLGHQRERDAPWLVAAWIGAAYWFTASTSFANPAITIARALTDTFAGIRPVDVPAFVTAQLIGATLAAGLARMLFEAEVRPEHSLERKILAPRLRRLVDDSRD